jgi:hypothetical protein
MSLWQNLLWRYQEWTSQKSYLESWKDLWRAEVIKPSRRAWTASGTSKHGDLPQRRLELIRRKSA